MNHRAFTFIFLIILLKTAGITAASSIDSFASFLAGILLIEESRNLSSEQKAIEYKNLQHITGISGSEAILFINSFRENPAEFKKIYNSVKAKLTGTEKQDLPGKNDFDKKAK